MADVLDIFLGDRKVGAIIGLGGDRTVFTFDDAYADDPGRTTLGLSFKDAMGDLIRDQKPTQTRLSPFFSNLLPEGPLRAYLAERAGVNSGRRTDCRRRRPSGGEDMEVPGWEHECRQLIAFCKPHLGEGTPTTAGPDGLSG